MQITCEYANLLKNFKKIQDAQGDKGSHFNNSYKIYASRKYFLLKMYNFF